MESTKDIGTIFISLLLTNTCSKGNEISGIGVLLVPLPPACFQPCHKPPHLCHWVHQLALPLPVVVHLPLLAHHQGEREPRVADEVEEERATPVHVRLAPTNHRAQLHTPSLQSQSWGCQSVTVTRVGGQPHLPLPALDKERGFALRDIPSPTPTLPSQPHPL